MVILLLPKTSVCKSDFDKKKNKNKSTIDTDGRYTVRELSPMTTSIVEPAHRILKNNDAVRKLSARWILHLLSDDQKRTSLQMPT